MAGRPRKDSTTKNNNENKSSISPYMLLNAWIRDGNLKSPLPKDIEDGKQFGPHFILYYFVSSPELFRFINKTFNNYNLWSLNTIDVLKTIKEIVYYTGFRQPFIQSVKKEENKLVDIIKEKYPYYKREEISMVVDIIDADEELQATIYENFNLRPPTKKKSNKKDFKEKLSKILSKESLFNDL